MYWILEKTEQETCCVKFVSIIREDFLWADRKTTDKRFIVLLNPQTAFDDEVSEERNAQRKIQRTYRFIQSSSAAADSGLTIPSVFGSAGRTETPSRECQRIFHGSWNA